jgi:hypothetical protein
VVALLVVLGIGACSDDGDDPETVIPADCGLPSPDPRIDASLVPKIFLADGKGQLASVEKERGGFVAAINVPFSVAEALGAYRTAVKTGGYEIVSEDNEGFEAEINFQGPKELGVVQIRRSTCDEASIVFVNLISKRSTRVLPTPTPTRS